MTMDKPVRVRSRDELLRGVFVDGLFNRDVTIEGDLSEADAAAAQRFYDLGQALHYQYKNNNKGDAQ